MRLLLIGTTFHSGGVVKVPNRPLCIVVRKAWVVENIQELGAGRMYHLAFHPDEVADEVIADLEYGVIGTGSNADMMQVEGLRTRQVSRVKIVAVHDYLAYLRFDLRLLRVAVGPWQEGIPFPDPHLLCGYLTNPQINVG